MFLIAEVIYLSEVMILSRNCKDDDTELTK